MENKTLFEFQEKQKKILAMLPPLKSKYIDYSGISFSGKSSHKAVFHLNGLRGNDLKKAVEKDPGILSYVNEAVLDQGILYIHAYFDSGKYFSIEKDGDYEIVVEGNGEDIMKNLIVVRKGVSCRIFFKTLGKGDLHISNSFYVEQKSECKVGVVNSFDGNLFLYNRGYVEAESVLDFYHASFSKSLERVFHEIYFIGDKARGNIFDLYFCRGQMDLNSRVYCKSRMNKSHLLSKGLLDSLGKVYFEGYAKIDNNADGADLFVGEHAIVLNKGAKANLVPNLEIENNNVKAGHAASVQQFDEEKLFYMQSRGLSEVQCKKLLIDGFLMSVIEKMEIPALQEEIQRRLQEHDAENM